MNIIELFTRLELQRDAISGHSANDIIRIEKQLNVERKLNPDIDTNTAANLISALRDYPRAFQMVLSVRHLYNFFTGKDLARKAFPESLPDVPEEEVRAFISRFLIDDLELRLDQALTNERFSTIRDFLTVKQYLPEESLHRLEKRVTGKLEFGIGRMPKEGAIDTSSIQYMRLMSFYEVLSNFRSIELDDKIRIVINRTSDMYNSRREAQFASDVMVCLPSYNAFDDELNRVTQGNSKIINGAAVSRSSSSSGSGISGRVVFLVIILIIKVIIFSSKCSNNSSSNYDYNSGYEPYGYTYDMRQADVQSSENMDYLAAFNRDSITDIKSVDTISTGQNPFKSSLVRRIPITYKSNQTPSDVTFTNDSPYDLILLEYFSYDYGEDSHDYEFALFMMTTMAANYQRIMLSKGFYVRGGIADGQVYFDENMIFSNALIKAYEIENKIAKYPRIVVDENALRKLKRLSKKNIIKDLFPELIIKDWTGLAFLNPFKFTDTIENMFTQLPEVVGEIENVITNLPQLLIEAQKLEPDILDSEFIEIVSLNVMMNLKKYKLDKDVLEKFTWLNEFINWQRGNKCNLEFKLYK